MEAIKSQVVNLSFEYELNGRIIRRNAIAEKRDKDGKEWVLVETSGDWHSSNKQWVELSFFKEWLVQMSAAA